MPRLANKIVIVTGGAQGIGHAIVERCAREGARVTFLDIEAARAEEALDGFQAAGLDVAFVRADVTSEPDVRAAVGTVLAGHGTVDVLVNNAGVNTYFDATSMTTDEWDAVFAVDLKGAWLCAKHVLPAMKTAGRGSIVNISSIHATLTIAGMFPYAAAKTGLVGLTRSLALDYAPHGIRVNAVLPGWTRTRLIEEWFALQADPHAAEARVLDAHPLRRLSTPAEVASVVAFVASDDASAITGAALAVDGGFSVQQST